MNLKLNLKSNKPIIILIFKSHFYSIFVAVQARPWTPPSCDEPDSSPEWEEALPKMAAAHLGLPVSSVMT
jgi:hypothetical protein